MIGRGALGSPTVFSKIKGINVDKSIFDIAIEHLSYIIEDKPEIIAVKEFRKHLLWYFKGLKNAAHYKRIANTVLTYEDCKHLLNKVKTENQGI